MHVESFKYKKEQPGGFSESIKKRVDDYFAEQKINRLANTKILSKVFFLPVAYIAVYSNLIFNVTSTEGILMSYIVLGILIPLTFFNVLHDAAHNSIFKTKKFNLWATHIFDLIGTSSYLWRMRHLQSHHIYPNVLGKDVDIKQSDIVRINPYQEYKWYHKYQHYYMPLLYLTYSFNWIFIRDFKDIHNHNLGPLNEVNHPQKEVLKLYLSKLFYISYMIIIPLLALDTSLQFILLAFILKHLALSAIAVFALLSSHVDENANFPLPNEKGEFEHTWAEHQLLVTSDYGLNNSLLTNLLGGFNLHVAHHLFPKINHAHSKALTKIIKKTAQEFGVPYREFTPIQAFTSHFNLLKKNSNFDAHHIFTE